MFGHNDKMATDVPAPSEIRRRWNRPGSINQPPMINSRFDMDVWTAEQLKRIEAQNEELIRQAREKCWQDDAFIKNKLPKTWEDDVKERNEEEELYLMKEFSKIIMDNIDVFKRLAEK